MKIHHTDAPYACPVCKKYFTVKVAKKEKSATEQPAVAKPVQTPKRVAPVRDENQKPLFAVRGLSKKFNKLEVLKGVDLEVYKGDVIAVIGPSGCGKSTLLRCLNCMEDPTGGSIYFRGEDIADFSVDINKHRQHIGMVFQQFKPDHSGMT